MDYAEHAIGMAISRRAAALLSWDGSDDATTIYLYRDRDFPTSSDVAWDHYQSRLKRLARYNVKEQAS